MPINLHSRVLNTLRHYEMVRPGDRVGVACSGGADSTALLHVLIELRRELGITLSVLHFNHQLRGAQADADERFVRDLASTFELDFFPGSADVRAEARWHKENVEAAGRRLRRDFFRRVVEGGRATKIAVAHTADDQAETVLAHLMRGTGLTGLAGIHPVSGTVIRPLLDVRRAELRTFLQERKQDWREDASNSDRTRMRARIRHGLLPVLEAEFSPQIVERLSSLASLAGTEEAVWSAMTESQFVKDVRKSERGLELDVAGLQLPEWFAPLVSYPKAAREATAALAQRLVRRIFRELQGDAFGITSQHVESVIHLAENKSSGRRVEFPHGIRVERQFDRLHFWLESGAPNEETCTVASAYEFDVDLSANSGEVVEVLTAGRRFCLKVIDWPAPESETKGSEQALDFAQLCLPLVLRSWRPGDAYRPAGRKRSHKLKELFQGERISLHERRDWPVLTSGGRVVWARRFPGAADCVAAGNTRKALIISET